MKTKIPIGPYHPLQEEPESFLLEVDGDRITGIDVRLSYNHRGIEKLSEGRTFEQVPFIVERICGICSNSHPYAYVLAFEELAGIGAPERARYIRTIVAELERIHSHYLWIGLAGHFLGYNTVFMWAWKHREDILDAFEAISGNRQSYAVMCPGGVRWDIDEDARGLIAAKLDVFEPKAELFVKAFTDDPVLHARLRGVGVLPKEDAIAYGALGPTVRASGLPIDVRRDHPYGAYDRVEWDVCVEDGCDVLAKALVRARECLESIRIIRQCLRDLPPGPIRVEPEDVPAGEGIGHVEAPRGECFHYVRSDGGNRPIRHKVRAPTFMNLPTCHVTVPGMTISDATIVLAAIDPCYCCTERAAAVRRDGTRVGWDELLRLSREKTERLRREIEGGG
ncbi:MAG: nickel-dependent hydrogenase large subunit [Planctomycetes bacterium]|nr:nickel-dependent hydrogenase large subunit [Planctomycetota bacterium]